MNEDMDYGPVGNEGKPTLNDFLTFRAMLTPVLIQVVFWIGIAIIVFSALGAIVGGEPMGGLGILVIGPLVWRFYCEVIIVLFKINDGVQTMVRQNR